VRRKVLKENILQRIIQVSIKPVKRRTVSIPSIIKDIKSVIKRRDREDYLADIAAILANIMLMGKEKTIKCQYYDITTGLCKLLKFDIQIPTLYTINVDGVWRVRVDKHPEICATCPYWKGKSS
jgi:hypothetical protein